MRISGDGRLVLIGGGEFSFGETEEVDRRWIELLPERGPIGFVPAASGSTEYGEHFADYVTESFGRDVETVPIYRSRDARRGKNLERLNRAAGIYLGGGLADHLLDAVEDSPADTTLRLVLKRSAGVVVAIAAAAQALGQIVRSPTGRGHRHGLGWLPATAVEANFDPDHPRRLEEALKQPGIVLGLGIPAGSAVVLGPADRIEVVGAAWTIDREGELHDLESGTVDAPAATSEETPGPR